ncbi:hypothetical protein [uncultured Flavobacterium sp.]|uniref:hypothetical protein n=1 Tax=uncultured Flavobacterium sp. TaxID=165435 RepID=UPI0012017933|nr:hypothetical protein [uncultured Flavobacterium sp.]THD32842.1 MAG: hypothetical protein DI588_06365 [Flavobacterium johnsoniae]
MENKTLIYDKLEAFIKKYYANELLKGLIFFIGLGLLYLLFTLFVEYFLWLKPTGRTILFWAFIAVEVFLLFRFIMFPIFKLFKLQKGIDYEEASAIIGSHFSEVNDKLKNFLQLSNDNNQSELLLASIDQKAQTLNPIPFGNAINFKGNIKFLPWAIIPILFFAFFMISGNSDMITQSFNRVVRYNERFSPPAPFAFEIINPSLQTEQGNDFVLQIKSQGKVVPENAMIYIDGESYFMESTKPGFFEYKFTRPSKNIRFHIEANQVTTKDFELAVVAVPTIANFEMVLNFPSYLNKKSETIQGSGNAIVPEGTKVTWKVATLATKSVEWSDLKTITPFSSNENTFQITKSIFQNTDYQILTSNAKVKHYEKLNYQISVIKDQFPTIAVNNAPDSLKLNQNVIVGQVSDDNGLSKLQIVFYSKNKTNEAKKMALPVKKDVFDQFIFTFPGQLPVEEGVSYEYYFEVFDNDALHGFKSTKSSVFSDRLATVEEKEEQNLQQQNDNINSLEKSIKNQDKQLSEIDKLQKLGKEKTNLEFKDQQKVNDFIQRQKQQEQMMKEFSKKMEDNLDKFKTDKKDEFKEELKERLEKAEKEIEKNEKLLDELQKLSEKLREEELFEKIDKFKQSSKNQTKNLEQLVELTKKYYVEKKAEQLAEKLDKLSEKQEALSNKDKENSVENQEDINKEFEKIQKELDQLEKDNEQLKKPIDLPKDEQTEKSIGEDLKKASDELKKDQKAKAKPKQKSAAQKMKQMSGAMMESMGSGEMEQLEEDVKMLRQILDNLLAYSFSQEDLMKNFKGLKKGSLSFNKNLKIQQDLKQQFKHVDDSLFAMSLRNPKLGENITTEIGNVHYNVDKALETLSDAQIQKGVSHQQYAVASSNKLADFLSEILNSMQMQMQMSGSGAGKPKQGQGQGMQLPDIIEKQKGLGEKMKEGMKKGEKPGEGNEGKDGKPGKEGKGKNSKSGNKEGEGGEDGEGNAGEILEIYKEQQRLREALQKALEKEGMGGSGQNALNQMKQIEKDLLNKGFKNETLQKMLNLKHELLKLDNAIQQQGEEKKRQSQTNKKEYNNQTNAISPALKQYLNSIEILNRQTLPLRPNFNQKVQEYFRKDD